MHKFVPVCSGLKPKHRQQCDIDASEVSVIVVFAVECRLGVRRIPRRIGVSEYAIWKQSKDNTTADWGQRICDMEAKTIPRRIVVSEYGSIVREYHGGLESANMEA